MDEDDVILLENSLKFLSFQQIWPKTEDELYDRKKFYIKYIFVTFSTSILLWGSLAHLLMALYGKTGAAIDVDISILVSIIGTYYFNFSYLANVKNIAIALKDLSDFKTFGMPPGMSDFNKKLNTISKWHQVYICMAIISLTSSGLLEIQACEAKNIERGIKDVCGLSIKIWVPFDIDYFPVKQVFFVIQTYSGYFSYATSSTISFSVMESMEHVVFRLMHVKMLFVKALNEDVYEIRKESLRHCIQYHNFVIRVGQSLSHSYSSCVFVHVLLTGAILGCNAYQLLQGCQEMQLSWINSVTGARIINVIGPQLNSIALFIGWFMSLLMVAFVGQRLVDESAIYRDAIYATKWYELEPEFQKDIILILLRSKKPIYLMAGAFGFMSYQIVLSILKTSYSLVSLMKGTS